MAPALRLLPRRLCQLRDFTQPGGDAQDVPVIRDLSLAGWEPITRARCADADIAVERFGPDRFTLFNGAAAEKRARFGWSSRCRRRSPHARATC